LNTMRPAIKALVLLAILLSVIAIVHLTPIRQSLEDVHAIRSKIESLGLWAPVAFTAGIMVLVAIGIPRLLLCGLGGMVFGFFWGLVWSQIGTLFGYYLTFLFVRWSGRDFILQKWPGLNRYNEFFREKGPLVVLLIRQMPIAGFYINMVLGLTHIGHVHFLVGTFLGILPEAVPAALIGAGVISLSPGKSTVAVSGAIVFLIIVWSLVGRYFQRVRATVSSPACKAAQIGKEEIRV
jgi:uncharacterized membrane protein YdjX (TVP38/TMEM64 family)